MLAGPLELAHGVRVPQQVMNHRLRERLLRAPRVQARLGDPLGAHLQRVVAGRGPLEELVDHRRGAGVGLDDALAIVAQDVDVLERRGGGPDPLGRLLAHPLGGRLGEVVDVVLRHEHLDAVDELLRRPRVLGEDDPLLHEVDLEPVHLVERDPVLEVSVEAVGLLDEEDTAGRGLGKKGEHLAEAGAPGALGCFNVDELLHDAEVVGDGVLPEELLLRRDGEALPLLVLGRHACVHHRVADGVPHRLGGGGGTGGTIGRGAFSTGRGHGGSSLTPM